jgi:hypothetical protein
MQRNISRPIQRTMSKPPVTLKFFSVVRNRHDDFCCIARKCRKSTEYVALARVNWLHHTMDRPEDVVDPTPSTLDSMLLGRICGLGSAGKDAPTRHVTEPFSRDGKGILCYTFDGVSAEAYLSKKS